MSPLVDHLKSQAALTFKTPKNYQTQLSTHLDTSGRGHQDESKIVKAIEEELVSLLDALTATHPEYRPQIHLRLSAQTPKSYFKRSNKKLNVTLRAEFGSVTKLYQFSLFTGPDGQAPVGVLLPKDISEALREQFNAVRTNSEANSWRELRDPALRVEEACSWCLETYQKIPISGD